MIASNLASSTLAVRTAAEVPDLYRSREFWEERFRCLGLWHEMLSYDVVSRKYSADVDKRFLDYQLVVVHESSPDLVIAVAHTVPLHVDNQMADLPPTGWDWVLEKAVMDHSHGLLPDSLCGLSISVLPNFQRSGVGSRLIREMILLATKRRLRNVIMPVRPISKEKWPYVSMDEFIGWQRDDGFHVDPWIRAHQSVGAAIVKACTRSMTVVAPLAQWENWYGNSFSVSDNYVVRGTLAPVYIDRYRGIGCYQEPNVWMVVTHLQQRQSKGASHG
jgi:GNAT superfamily N-acetyltransferase